MFDIKKILDEALQDPVVVASAIVISLVKPYITQQLGLSGQEQQALPQQSQQFPHSQQSYQ